MFEFFITHIDGATKDSFTKAPLLESFGSLKISNFRYTPSCLQLLRKLMSDFSLFLLYASFSYFWKF